MNEVKKLSLHIAACLPLFAFSETEEEIPTVVVTGTKTATLLQESPVPVEVITAEEIEQTQANTLDEMLDVIPSLILNDIHGSEGTAVMMQGLTGPHVLVLIDGVPVNQTSMELSIERIFANDVERIEIVPGASSALYGSQAMGGVINIITKKNEESYLDIEVSASQTETDTTNWPTTLSTNLNGGLKVGDLFLDNSLALTQYAGVDDDPDTYPEQLASGYRWSLNEKVRYQDLTFKFDWLAERLERPYEDFVGITLQPHTKYENSNEYSATFLRDKTYNSQAISIEYDHYETIQDLNITDYDDFVREAAAWNLYGDSDWSFDIYDHTLTTGLTGQYESVLQEKQDLNSSSDTSVIEEINRDAYIAGVFLQDQWFIGNDLQITTGLRGDWHSDFNEKLTGRLAGWWQVTPWLYTRASIGQGYRTPTIKELGYTFDHSHIGYMVLGNTDLKPETSLSYQGEIGGSLGLKNSTWSLLAYRQEIENLIDTTLAYEDSDGISIYEYYNYAEALIQGVDAKLVIPFTAFNQRVKTESSYHYIDALDKETDLRLEERPTHQFKTSIQVRTSLPNEPTLSIRYRYQMDEIYNGEKTPDYGLLDASYLQPIFERWQLALSAENLTNELQDSESDSDTRPQLGRVWKISLRYRQ